MRVASVRLAAPPDGRTPARRSSGIPGPGNNDPGRFSARLNLLNLIIIAYDIPGCVLSEQSDLGLVRVDVEARMPVDTTREQFNVMLQNLLANRLGLKVHWAIQQIDMYSLADGGERRAEVEGRRARFTSSARRRFEGSSRSRVGSNGFPVPPHGNGPWVGATPDGKMGMQGAQ